MRHLTLLAIAAIFSLISATYIFHGFQDQAEYTGRGLTYIYNDNKLDAVFEGQHIEIRPAPGRAVSEICFSIYNDAWSDRPRRSYEHWACFDAESGLVGPCNGQSEIYIGGPEGDESNRKAGEERQVYAMNGALIMSIDENRYNDKGFLCSDSTSLYLDNLNANLPEGNGGLVPESFRRFYNHIYSNFSLTFKEPEAKEPLRSFCIKSGEGQYYKFQVGLDEYESKKEIQPQNHSCVEGGPIAIEMGNRTSGVWYVSYFGTETNGKNEEEKKYSFTYSDSPYSVVYNPNFFNFIWPQNISIEKDLNMYLDYYDHFYILSEYNDYLDGVWLNCNGELTFIKTSGLFSIVKIDQSLCNHSVSSKVNFFAQSVVNGSPGEYTFVSATSPSLKNFSWDAVQVNKTHYEITISVGPLNTEGLLSTKVIIAHLSNNKNFWHNYTQINEFEYKNSYKINVKGGRELDFIFELLGSYAYVESVSKTIPLENLPPYSEGIVAEQNTCFPTMRVRGLYIDPEGDAEGDSSYSWFLENGTVLSKSDEIESRMLFMNISVSYTPVDSHGKRGETFQLNAVNELFTDYCIFEAVLKDNRLGCAHIENNTLRELCQDIVQKEGELVIFDGTGDCWFSGNTTGCEDGWFINSFLRECANSDPECLRNLVDNITSHFPTNLFEKAYLLEAVKIYDVSLCSKIHESSLRMKCETAVSVGSKDCVDRKLREKMFCIAFLTQDKGFCDLIDLHWYRKSCYSMFSEKENLCDSFEGIDRDMCLIESSITSGSAEKCRLVSDDGMMMLCQALTKRDTAYCKGINDQELRERCYREGSYD